jgi:hypothetical protein
VIDCLKEGEKEKVALQDYYMLIKIGIFYLQKNIGVNYLEFLKIK